MFFIQFFKKMKLICLQGNDKQKMTDFNLKLDFMEKGIPDNHKQYINKIHDVIKIYDVNEYILDTMETIMEPIMENEEEFRNLFYIISVLIVYFTFIICSIRSFLNEY